jgi:tetratricopeptide (TPR) repeat protein
MVQLMEVWMRFPKLTGIFKLIVSALLLLLPSAFAQSLVVYPFSSQDTLSGVAVADRVAQAFAGELEVYGPEVSPGLPAPLLAPDGFFPVYSALSLDFPIDSAGGARVLREMTGADAVITGKIALVDDGPDAEVYIARPDGVRTFSVSSPEDDPSLLVQKIIAVTAARLNVARSPLKDFSIDLSGPYGEYVNAVSLVGAGLLEDALGVLEAAQNQNSTEEEPRLQTLYDAVRAVLVGQDNPQTDLMAVMSLSLGEELFDEATTLSYFETLSSERSLPVFKSWVATLQASSGVDANAAFDVAAEAFPYGFATRAAYRAVNGSEDLESDMQTLLESTEVSSVYSASLISSSIVDDPETTKAAYTRLTQIAPGFAGAFEALSDIAFSEDDAKAAATNLAIASRLNPDNTRLWTNLGWSYYLLGSFEKSEEYSRKSVELQGDQLRGQDYIPWYNLGLVQAVTGRLEEAMESYARAVELDLLDIDDRAAADPGVDDASVLDLENALELYPNQPAIHFALANLYEQEDRRDEAREQYELYASLGEDLPLRDEALARVEVLNQPLPDIEISPGASVRFGNVDDAEPYHPGDRLSVAFELYTPGSELPGRATVSVALKATDGNVLSQQEGEVQIPRNAIGYVVRNLTLDIPVDAAPGTYTVEISASATGERVARSVLEVAVEGEPSFIRQLVSRNIVMTSLQTEAELYSSDELLPDNQLFTSLLSELQSSAEAAEEVLPTIESGRFEGQNGGELFTNSTQQDIRDFLGFVISSGAADTELSFVDSYAQWALDGAPIE